MNPMTWNGWNIFKAAGSGRIDIVRLLIEEHKEDPNIIDSNGHRPIDYAIADDRQDVRVYLESVGGESNLEITYPPKVPAQPDSPRKKSNLAIRVLHNLFAFDGRIGRLGYIGHVILAWVVALIVLAAGAIIATIVGLEQRNGAFFFIMWVTCMTGFSIHFSAGAKRLHDFDMNGWMQIIPIFNIIVYFMMVFRKASLPISESKYELHWGSQLASQFEKILAIGLITLLSLVLALSSLQEVQA